MPYLIDGYNLLHAMGLMSRRTGPQGLEWARLRLIAFLHGTLGDHSKDVTVVFDAADAPPSVKEEQEVQGIHVLFAVRHAQADDLIEQLIRRDATPRRLSVVSDDHRIQQAARRRQCKALGCSEYLEELERLSRKPRRQEKEMGEKADGLSEEELRHWMEEFADLKDDPEFKKLSDLYRFESDHEEGSR